MCSGTPDADRAALLALYEATDGPSWRNNSGWSTAASDLKQFYGVTVDAACRVIAIDLSNNKLNGQSMPAPNCNNVGGTLLYSSGCWFSYYRVRIPRKQNKKGRHCMHRMLVQRMSRAHRNVNNNRRFYCCMQYLLVYTVSSTSSASNKICALSAWTPPRQQGSPRRPGPVNQSLTFSGASCKRRSCTTNVRFRGLSMISACRLLFFLLLTKQQQ